MEELPVHGYGFVEVFKGVGGDGTFPIVRSQVEGFDSSVQGVEVLFGLFKSIQKDVAKLRLELASVRRNGRKNKWIQRYSKRCAVGGNLVMAAWIFLFHFLVTLRGNGKVRTKVIELLKEDIIYGEQRKMRKIAFSGAKAGLSQSLIFLFFSFLLTRPVTWCRGLGVISAMTWSLYRATVSPILTWQHYANAFCNLLYFIFSRKKHKPLLSVEEFIGREERKHE